MKTRKILSLISALVFALAAPASLAEGLALIFCLDCLFFSMLI